MKTNRQKRRRILVSLFLITCLFSACGKTAAQEQVFQAVITEIGDGNMLVTPEAGSEELKSSDSFIIPIQSMPASPEPHSGDIVEIRYTGDIQETYPAGLDKVVSITIVEPAADSVEKADDEGTAGIKEDTVGTEKAAVSGPYGTIFVDIPENWDWQAVSADEDGLLSGLYGLILKPADAKSGWIELTCQDSFGVCGTGLVQEEITIAGGSGTVGTFDDHEHWDYITFGNDQPGIVAQSEDCDAWSPEIWDQALDILDTLRFDLSQTEGCIGQYVPESEDEEIGVIMDVHHVIPTGSIVRFRQYDETKTGEVEYGERFSLEKKKGDTWEDVPMVTQEAAFTDIAYIIPEGGESEIETDWQWLYGVLSPGTYRICKTVYAFDDNGYSEHVLYAQFLIAGK